MPQQIQVAHQVPGRVRLKVPHIRGNTKAAKHFNDMASSMDGVSSVVTSPVTGSMVVHYDKNDPHMKQRLQKMLKDMNTVLSIAVPEIGEAKEIGEALAPDISYLANHFPVLRPVARMFQGVDRQIQQATGGAMDLATLLPLILGGALVFLGKKNAWFRNPVLLGSLFAMSLLSYVALTNRQKRAHPKKSHAIITMPQQTPYLASPQRSPDSA